MLISQCGRKQLNDALAYGTDLPSEQHMVSLGHKRVRVGNDAKLDTIRQLESKIRCYGQPPSSETAGEII